MAFTTGDNNFGTAKWIVDATAGQGTHTTIGAALTASSSGETIFIRPGTYTENLSLKAGVNLVAYQADSFTPNVTIVGKATFTAAGTVSISGIRLQTNTDFVLAVTGANASIVNLIGCYLNLTNNTGISYTVSNTSADVVLINCQGNLGTTGVAIYSMSSTGTLGFESCYFTNTGASSTANTNSAGVVDVLYCTISSPFSVSGAGGLFFEGSIIDSSSTNTTAVTTAGTATHGIGTCQLTSGTASCISIGVGTTVNLVSTSINSTNANVLTGAGTLAFSLLTFVQNSGNNVVTQNPYVTDTTIVGNGGTGRTTLTNHSVLVGAATSAITQVGPSATTGAPLISAGAAADPTFSTTFLVSDSTFVTKMYGTNAGAYNLLLCTNPSNTAGSGSVVKSQSAGTSSGNALFQCDNTVDTQWTWGMAAATNSTFRIAASGNIGTTDTFVITRAGEITKPLQPAFNYYNSSGRSNVTGDGTAYTLIFNSANWTQQGSGFDGTSTFTAPVTGVYDFNLMVRSTGYIAQTSVYVTINVSTGVVYYGQTLNPANSFVAGFSSGLSIGMSALIKMTAGQSVTCQIVAAGSTKTISIDGTQSDTYFSGVLLC